MKTDQYSGIMCSWCGRIKDDHLGWILTENEAAIQGPLTSHGLCDDCYDDILGDFLQPVPLNRQNGQVPSVE